MLSNKNAMRKEKRGPLVLSDSETLSSSRERDQVEVLRASETARKIIRSVAF